MELQSNNEYSITLTEVIDGSEFTEAELVDTFGEGIEGHLNNISRKTYRALYSAYCGWEIDQQVLELQEIINLSETKQDVMKEAMIEYVRGAMYSGLDLQVYLGGKGYSEELKDILYAGGLWIIEGIVATDDIKAV
jgi:hypothetical protein